MQRTDTLTDMRKSSVEPVESDDHDSSIDDDDIRRHGKPEYHKLASIHEGPLGTCYLLPRVEEVHVDGIHARLTRCSTSKQQSIDVCNLLACKDQQRANQSRSDDVDVCTSKTVSKHENSIREMGDYSGG